MDPSEDDFDHYFNATIRLSKALADAQARIAVLVTAARPVAEMADSRHPWADAKTWWDAICALRATLAEPPPHDGEGR